MVGGWEAGAGWGQNFRIADTVSKKFGLCNFGLWNGPQGSLRSCKRGTTQFYSEYLLFERENKSKIRSASWDGSMKEKGSLGRRETRHKSSRDKNDPEVVTSRGLIGSKGSCDHYKYHKACNEKYQEIFTIIIVIISSIKDRTWGYSQMIQGGVCLEWVERLEIWMSYSLL